jgi:peptide/nickel transport system substrate-binding protein
MRRILTCSTLAAFAVIACALVALLGSLYFTRGTVDAQSAGNRIVYGLTFLPSGFDPHINQASELGIPLRSVYDTLVYRDPDTKQIVPGLASSWDVSPDGMTYTFHLKSGVKFQDGTPFNADAVAYNFDRITNPANKSQKAVFLLGPVDYYTVVDPLTFKVLLKEPFSPLLDGLAQVYTGIASPTALKQYGLDRYQMHQVGTGPYMMTDFIPGDHITLRRNPDYAWGPSFYTAPSKASLDEIEFRFFTDPATRAPALLSGSAMVMGELAPTDAQQLTGNPSFRLIPQAVPGQPLQFLFNTKQAPTDKLEIRQALLTATDRTAIVDAVFQEFSPVAYGPLNAVTLDYNADVKKYYPFDANGALDAFSKLGYALDPDTKILTKDKDKLHLKLVIMGTGFQPEVSQKLQSQWKDLGIEVEIKQVPTLGGLLDVVKSGDYNLIAFNLFGLDPSILNTMYGSKAPNNFMGLSDSTIDQLLADANKFPDSDPQRAKDYAQIQQMIMDQALILPIRDYVNLNAASATLNNLKFDPYGWFPLLANVTVGK